MSNDCCYLSDLVILMPLAIPYILIPFIAFSFVYLFYYILKR